MAIRATNFEMFAVERKPSHRIVIELIVAGLHVAAFALVTKPTFVHVIISVTTLRRAVLGRAREFAGWVTVFAFVLLVLTLERPLGIFIVAECQRGPGTRHMTTRALFAE